MNRENDALYILGIFFIIAQYLVIILYGAL